MHTFIRCLLVLGLIGAPAFAHAADTPRQLNLPAGKLADALDKLGEQAGVQIMYEPSMAEGIQVTAINATLTVRDALERLLKKTMLRADAVNEKTMILKRITSTSSMLNPVDTTRLAASVGPEAASSAASETRDQVVVQGDREQRLPYAGNADIARTINDVQPYFMFDGQTIRDSGAPDIESFLKQHLTMNAVSLTNAQDTGASSFGSFAGTTSTVDLRGLGKDKTLILVNGRRMAPVNNTVSAETQPDLNGIPLSAIERIEVLPSSASGIYGGSAIGGVVNVILKRDFAGGEVRMRYDNSVDGDSPARNLSASYGFALEGGRTHLSFSGAWSESRSLLLKDRAAIYQRNIKDIESRVPTFIYSNTSPWLGSLPNIAPSVASATSLVLKPEYGGTVFGARNTFVPAGTAPGGTTAALAAALLGNAGQWNMDFPASTQAPTGLLRPLGSAPQTRSLRASLRRQMLPWLELSADLSWNENRSETWLNPNNLVLTVPGPTSTSPGARTNPFTTSVYVRFPDTSVEAKTGNSKSRSATVGAIARLPGGWTGALDYTWSASDFDYLSFATVDTAARNADLLSGDLNPFVDTLLYPLNFARYRGYEAIHGASRLQELSLRGTGSLPALPWGTPNLTVGLQHRLTRLPQTTSFTVLPITVADSRTNTYYARDALTSSAYMELSAPLVKAGWLPAVHSLDLQLAGRSERFRVDTGTPSYTTYYNRNPVVVTYYAPTLDANTPIFSQDTYGSTNHTVGLKYQPVKEVTLRVSRATAFLPPAPAQLLRNPQRSAQPTPVNDPRTNQTGVPVYTLSGGNPDLEPQSSKSLNVGIIWEPQWKPLAGLRINAEYYRIEQFEAIGSLSAQGIVEREDLYPERITRDANGTITEVDTSLVNLYHRDTAGWDLNLDYTMQTRIGIFRLTATETIIKHLKNQYSLLQPESDAVNFPSEGGAAKYKSSASLGWESGPLSLSWSLRYGSSYKQYGAPGGPSATSLVNSGRPVSTTYTLRQGSETVASQMYHDLLVGYSFARAPGATGRMYDGLSLQLGVRNLFDKVPPMDAYYAGTFYLSPLGDIRLRSYWLNATLGF